MSSPDAGAREIHRLLTAPNPALQRALKAQATTLQHGLKVSKGAKPGLVIPAGAVESVRTMRRVYHDLRSHIAAIETQRRDAKRRVLSALDLLDASLWKFSRSLTTHDAATGAELARQAYWQRENAHTQLSRAVRDLR